jgi:hypothetical protein
LQEKKLSNKNAVLRILLSLANKQCIADTIYSFVNVLKILPSLSVDQREAKKEKGKGRSYLYYLYLRIFDLNRLFRQTAEYIFKQKSTLCTLAPKNIPKHSALLRNTHGHILMYTGSFAFEKNT